MALPSSGTISLQAIAAEFGGSAPHAISEYYRGGGLVPNTSVNAGIPTSGQIAFSNFYGGSATSPITYTGATSATSGTTTTLSLQIPSSAAAGDIALISLYRRGSNTVPTTPAGFTNLVGQGINNNALNVVYKFLTSSDPGTFVTSTASDRLVGTVVCYRNVSSVVFIANNADTNNRPIWLGSFPSSAAISRGAFFATGFKNTTTNIATPGYIPSIVNYPGGSRDLHYKTSAGSPAGTSLANRITCASYDTIADFNNPSDIPISNGQDLFSVSDTWDATSDNIAFTIGLIGN